MGHEPVEERAPKRFLRVFVVRERSLTRCGDERWEAVVRQRVGEPLGVLHIHQSPVHAVPDELRGRLSAVQIAVVQGGPRLGDLEAGGVADAFGTSFSVVSGGVACMVGAALLAIALPRFRNQQAPRLVPAAD